MLLAAYQQMAAVVIVSHSFECIYRDPLRPRPNRVVVRRFERLCKFLASNRDKFITSTFHDPGLQTLPAVHCAQPLLGRLRHTFSRGIEQAWKRMS